MQIGKSLKPCNEKVTKMKLAQALDKKGSKILNSLDCLKGPSQPFLCFCLHARVLLLLFYLENVKRKGITGVL